MEQIDRDAYVSRYEERLERHGYSPAALGWGKGGRQDIRFSILSAEILRQPYSSVLDVGCGFGDLIDFLRARGWRGRYTGIDLVGKLLDIARQRHPDDTFRQLDASTDLATMPPHDFVVASGVFSARLLGGSNQDHIERMLTLMLSRSLQAVAADFLSTWVDDTWHDPAPETTWHTDPLWALATARRLTRRVILRADHMPFEFGLIMFKDDSVSDRNVFNAFTAIGSGMPRTIARDHHE